MIHRGKYLLILFLMLKFGVLVGRSETLQIVAGGDLMLGSWVEEVVQQHGWDYPFVNLDTVLSDADLVFANLEAAFGQEDSAIEKTYTFQVSPDLVQVLLAGRINAVSLANNHILDFGVGALQTTIKLLKEYNVSYSGAGMNLAEARKPAEFNLKGKKISLASYSLTFPEDFWATDSTAGTCFPSHTFFYKDIRNFRKNNDIVILSFHWGGELMDVPKEYQTELAHRAIDAGADLILGHHPHVVQGIEIYKGKIIAYSLGNFIFGSYSDKATTSMLLKIFCGTNGLESCKIYPIDVYNKNVEFQPRLLEGDDKTNFFKELNDLSRELNQQPIVINNAGIIEL